MFNLPIQSRKVNATASQAMVLDDVFKAYITKLDAGQYLYDWIRANVKTCEDYILTHNALIGSLELGYFLAGELPEQKSDYHAQAHEFRSRMLKELNTLAQERNYTAQAKLQMLLGTAALVKNDRWVADNCENFNDVGVYAASLAAERDVATASYLRQAKEIDACPMASIVSDVYNRYIETATRMMVKEPAEIDLLAHLDFLKQTYVKYYLVDGFRHYFGVYTIVADAIVKFLQRFHHVTALFDTDAASDQEAEREFQLLSNNAIRELYQV